MDSLLSQTASEVLGQFRPGKEAVVFAVGDVAADTVAAHERAHKALTCASSFGRYLSALATAMHDCEDERRLNELGALLEFGIEQCWVVQEAYATAAQQLHTTRFHGAAKAGEDWTRLPADYKAALESLPEVEGDVRAAVAAELAKMSPPDVEGVIEDLTRACLSVVAGAAMGVPVSRFLAAVPADLSALNGWIRRNSPDGRLPLLVQQCTPQRVASWARGILRATVQAARVGITHPRDAFLASAQASLCDVTGLAYEASDAVVIQSVLRAIGSDVQVHEVDLRQVPIDSQATYFSAPIRLAPHQVGMDWTIGWSDAVAELRAFRGRYPGAVTTVVCEVICSPSNDEVLGALHLFVPSRLASAAHESGEAIACPSRPARVLSVPFETSAPQLALMADEFPNRAWCWLGYQEMFAGDQDWLDRLLRAGSAAMYTVPTLAAYRDRQIDDWGHVALPRTDAHPGWRVAGAPQGWEPAALLIPHGAVLAYRDYTDREMTFRSVELLAVSQFLRTAGELSYADDCVAQVLAFGHYSLQSRMASEQ